MEVLNTSPSLFPTLTGQIALTKNPNTFPAPPSGLAPAEGISPFGRIPLGHGERGNYSQATDSQITLSAFGGAIHNAPIGTRPFYSLSEDFRGTVGPTQPYLTLSVLEGRSFRPITTTLVTYAAGPCKHLLSPAHRGWIPAQSLTSAYTFPRATRHGRGSSKNLSLAPPTRQRPVYLCTGGGGGAPHLETPHGPTSTQPSSIQSIDDRIRILRTHSHEDFATLVNNYEDDQCTPC
jgi:hypothetical protein